MTLSADTLARLFANVAGCMGNEPGAYIQGINMEGPYIAPSKKGAQNASFIRPPDKAEFRRLYDGCRRHHPCGGYRPGGAGRRGIHP